MYAVLLEGHLVSNGNEWKLEKHLVVRRWELQEAAKIWKKRIWHKDQQANPKDMGPTCKQVVALIGSILEQVMSVSFTDWVFCTKMDWLHPSHRAEKRRQDGVSHGRPHSSR